MSSSVVPERAGVVVTGLSGRLPESDTIEQFAQQLFDGVDLVTDDGRRWTPGLFGLPERSGKLKDVSRFDAAFFGVHSKQAQRMDPQARLLLELTHEAIVDAGLNPAELRGSRTGVYLGVSMSESGVSFISDANKITGYEIAGTPLSIFANRISYAFDLKGPSYAIDSACSSSLTAFVQAVESMRSGRCDAAIVAGTNLCLLPTTSISHLRFNILSPEGRCASFDASRNGYVRAEAAVVVLLQMRNAARRVYATVRGAGMNSDGSKNQGFSYPSSDMQRRLAEETFAEAGLCPQDVTYVEAHGTGTEVGDPQEVNTIAEVFCKNRRGPLRIGSVKSNMGHSECASGLCSVTKVLVAMERGELPANLHYSTPNPDIPALSDGRIQVVTRNTKWDGGLVAINSYGFGGANALVILESQCGVRPPPVQYAVPRLVVASGRTEQAVRQLLSLAKRHPTDSELHALLDAVHTSNIPRHSFRGYTILADVSIEDVLEYNGETRPIWFVFAGMGSQWPSMARTLMALPVFTKSVARSAAALRPHGIDLTYIITEAPNTAFDDVINSFVSITAVQVALVDTLRELGIHPDGLIGHSFGEIGCAYADDTLTNEQAVLCAYWRGRSIIDSKLEPGAMAVVGLSWEQCEARLPSEVVPACHNAADSVTVSGPLAAIERLVAELTAEGVFARRVNSSGVAFHSKYIVAAAPLLRQSLERVIFAPRPRSARWISSSLPRERWGEDIAKLSNAAYHVNNLLSPVRFAEALRSLPERALVVEIAPHALMQAILRRALPHAKLVPLVRSEAPDPLQHLLTAVGKAYAAGVQPSVARLYPPVAWPVSRGTPNLASHISWDHSIEWPVVQYSSSMFSGENVIEYDLSNAEDAFLTGHSAGGNIIFPAAGYLAMVWRTAAGLAGRSAEQTAVIMEDVKFLRATVMPRDGPVRFLVSIFDGSRQFEVCEGGEVVASGFVHLSEDASRERLPLPASECTSESNQPLLLTSDIYKELHLRGYHYSGVFRGIRESDQSISVGKFSWEDNWVSFIDLFFQYNVLSMNTRELYLITRLQRILIDPVQQSTTLETAKTDAVLAVHLSHDLNVMAAGGVEIRGIKFTLAPSIHCTHAPPKLEKYVFVPYDNATLGTKSHSLSKPDMLITCLQLVLENTSVLNLKIVEASLGNGIALLLPIVLPLLTVEPQVRVNSSIRQLNLKGKDLDLISDDKESKCHLVLVHNFLAKLCVSALMQLTELLTNNGMLLLEETPCNLIKPETFDALNKAGLDLVSHQVGENCEYLLLKRRTKLPKIQAVIELDEGPTYEWVDKLKEVWQRAREEKMRVYLVARGRDSGVLGLATSLRKEVGGEVLRVYYAPGVKDPFCTEHGAFAAQARLDLAINVLRSDVWGCYRHLPLENTTSTGLVQVEHAYVNTLTRGDLSSLRWIESSLRYASEMPQRPDRELCRVYYASLNFRDVMLATGKLPPDALPGQLAGRECILGLEFSGRLGSGERVMGMVAACGLATTVLADTAFLWPVPRDWTLEQAATVPVAYATAYYALSVRGRMRRGESVLVHAGSGGVGQAAITIALQAGCTVFTTVGTPEKRTFLLQRFPQLEDANIGNSRDSSFEQLILQRTRGRGVDLVLNSLAADKLFASVRCLAPGGRFLEIGKVDLSKDTPLGMSIFLKNTTFHGILLDALFDEAGDDVEKMMVVRCVNEGIASGIVRPLPYTIYPDQQLEQAFRYMATGKHVGKVLIRIREEEEDGVIRTKPHFVSAVPRTYINPERTYILVGGLGGFGLELAQWLVERGARRLVLSSRRGVRSGYQAWRVRRWSEQGVRVAISRADVTTASGAEELLHEAATLGPVGGIFNLAAVLKDSFLDNLTPEDFHTSAAPKLDATRALDVTSRELAPELEYFVVTSSIASGRGSLGQSNYAFANSCMERIMEQRQADGLPGLAVQWGPIDDVGLVRDRFATGGETVDVELEGTIPQRLVSCLQTLDRLIRQPHSVLSVFVLADENQICIKKQGQVHDLVHKIANILGFKDARSMSQSASLAEFGVDSLMGVEIRQTLKRNYGIVLSAQEIRKLTFAHLHELSSSTKCVTQK